MSKIQIEIPEGIRTGQFIYGFLEWLEKEKNVGMGRNELMADPFYIGNLEFEEYLKDYIKYLDEQRTEKIPEGSEGAIEETKISSEDEGPARTSFAASGDAGKEEPEVQEEKID